MIAKAVEHIYDPAPPDRPLRRFTWPPEVETTTVRGRLLVRPRPPQFWIDDGTEIRTPGLSKFTAEQMLKPLGLRILWLPTDAPLGVAVPA